MRFLYWVISAKIMLANKTNALSLILLLVNWCYFTVFNFCKNAKGFADHIVDFANTISFLGSKLPRNDLKWEIGFFKVAQSVDSKRLLLVNTHHEKNHPGIVNRRSIRRLSIIRSIERHGVLDHRVIV